MQFLSFLFLCLSTIPPSLRIPETPLVETKAVIEGPDEVAIVDDLILVTTRQLETQKQLRSLMLDFQKQQEEFVQGNQSKVHAKEMVRTARQIYEMISANHIQHLFPNAYLEELSFFSSIAGKTALSRP
ncbi:MAG: hypothetical protein JSS61_04635 [Verrucomicrobia bacterium]|nr:hypothetical protein [Verrucomicrobiota bacterium]